MEAEQSLGCDFGTRAGRGFLSASRLTFEPQMNDTGKLILKVIGAFLVAMAWFFFSTLIAGTIITALPRPMLGEAPELPKAVCLGIVFTVQFAIPAVATFAIVRNRPLRIGCLVAAACAMLINHRMLEGFDLLEKAWRRGL